MKVATRILSGLWIGLWAFHTVAATEEAPELTFEQSAEIIRHTYENQLFTLEPSKQSHYGLRMYRQTLDGKRYAATIHTELNTIASTLNHFADKVNTPEQIVLYAQRRLAPMRETQDERSQRRYNVSKNMPEYVYLGIDLLSAMARANEYGLQHREDDKLRQVLRRYDFNKYATSKPMIEAWAPQLAAQVFWLRELGEQDVVDAFIDTFRETYPDEKDASLTAQQYRNKIYTMTHIIEAMSHRYQTSVNEGDQQWIYDYFRQHIDTILLRATPKVIAQVGISFLLAGLDNDAVVEKTREAVRKAISTDMGMIPSATGEMNLSQGEQRNVLAIMLLDWQGVHASPTVSNDPNLFANLPYGLVAKNGAN